MSLSRSEQRKCLFENTYKSVKIAQIGEQRGKNKAEK